MPDQSQPQKSLGDRASRAAVLMTGQAIYVKAAALALQLVLAKLLLRDDFGLYGLALTVYSFAALFHQAGILDVLVARRSSFDIWASIGFWISITIGFAAFAFTVMIAPVAASFYKMEDPAQLVRLISTMALVFPISAAGAVNRAKLQLQMRFRELAIIGVIVTTLDVVLKIAFAFAGFGAFSFAYGAIVRAVCNLALCWWFAPIRIRLRPQLRRWKYLLHDGMMVVGSLFFLWVIEEGDYIVLGRFESVAVVGVYFFAFRISRHVMSLLTFQMSRVLFPALSNLPSESVRQVDAFIVAARLIAVVCFPVCFAMAAVADPLVRVCFEPKWYDAIPLMQIMCLGMTIRTMSWPITSLFKAQGRFRTHMLLVAGSICIFFPMTILGTWLGSSVGLAIAVAIFYSISTLCEFILVVRPAGKEWSRMFSVFAAPMAAGTFATLMGCAVAYVALPRLELKPIVEYVAQIIAVFVVGIGVYVPLVRVLARDVWEDAVRRGQRLMPSRLRK